MRCIYLALLSTWLVPGTTFLKAQDTTCGIVWDEPILLSDSAYDAIKPHLAVSGEDIVHVIWAGGGRNFPYARSIDGGAHFVPQELLEDSLQIPGGLWTGILAEGSSVQAFFVPAAAIGRPIHMKTSSNAGQSWTAFRTISDTVGVFWTPARCGDTLCLVICPFANGYPGDYDILRSTDAGTTWTRAYLNLSPTNKVTLSRGGILHLLTEDRVTGETFYRRSDDLGNTWKQQELISELDGFMSLDASIAGFDSLVIAAWRDPKYGHIGWVGESIICRIGIVGQDSTRWLPEQVLTGMPAGYNPIMNIGKGRIAAAWLMDQNTSPFAEVRTTRDTSWCPATAPALSSTRSVTNSAIALSSTAIHVVWEANLEPNRNRFMIFYRRGTFVTNGVSNGEDGLASTFWLHQNYPNPFNPTTTITYGLRERTSVVLKVFDVLGREVAQLVNEHQEPGRHSVLWDATNVSSGVYMYRLSVSEGPLRARTMTRTMMLVR
jgi:hypothetical protein